MIIIKETYEDFLDNHDSSAHTAYAALNYDFGYATIELGKDGKPFMKATVRASQPMEFTNHEGDTGVCNITIQVQGGGMPDAVIMDGPQVFSPRAIICKEPLTEEQIRYFTNMACILVGRVGHEMLKDLPGFDAHYNYDSPEMVATLTPRETEITLDS